MYSTLCWNPAWRSSAQEALKHSYFRLNSQPNSASSNHAPFALALKPTGRSRRPPLQQRDDGGGGGVRVPVPLVPVEAVYDREGLRNNKDDPSAAAAGDSPAAGHVVTQKDQEDLKQLLESLKANDVMPVVAPYRKVSNNMNNNFSHQQQQQQHRMHHRPSFLNLDGEEPPGDELTGGANARRYHPPFSFAKYPKLGGGGPLPGPASYVPSFGGPPPRQAAPLAPTTRVSEAHPHHELSRNGPVIGRGLFADDKDTNQNPVVVANGRVHFGGTKETVANFSTKMDFTARVVESFSGFHLDGHDSAMLGMEKTRSPTSRAFAFMRKLLCFSKHFKFVMLWYLPEATIVWDSFHADSQSYSFWIRIGILIQIHIYRRQSNVDSVQIYS
jgi:hypothetical protein